MKRIEGFEALYRRDPDPWRYRTSPYEAAKHRATLRALGQARFARGLEIGCSIGVLSAMLARRCTRFTGVDASPTAIASAEALGISNARFVVGTAPDDLPSDRFDLIVASEVLYYLPRRDLRRLAKRLRASCGGAECVIVSYTGRTDAVFGGPASCDIFLRELGASTPMRYRTNGPFRLVSAKVPDDRPR